MKTNPEQQTYIREKFAALTSKSDLLGLLNEAQRMMYGEKARPFRLRDLTYYANPELCKKRYKTFTIAKKNGGERTINAPVKGMKVILRTLNFILQAISEPHPAATGFVLERSIVDNARAHVGKHYVYNLDLKDFFHSFDRNRVKMGFMRKPFNLRENKDKEKLAFFLSCLCTDPFEVEGEMKTVLPQGSPTSPTITNVLCQDLDRRLNGLAKKYNLSFTRYADDITFSSSHNIFKDEEFQKELQRIIEEDQQFIINPTKTRLQKTAFRQEATGLIVNEKVNVKSDYVKQLRMWLYYWEKYGEKRAEQIFQRDYKLDKGHVKPEHPGMANVIAGKLEFVKMVKGTEDPTFKKLKERFQKLHGGSPLVEKLLHTWDNQDIEKAIEIQIQRTPPLYSSIDPNINIMKKEHASFITGLISNPKLSASQRDKVVELALRDLSKNGSEKRILQDLELIKKKLEILPQGKSDNLSTEPVVVTRFDVPEMSEEDKLGFREQLSPEEFKKYFGENQEVRGSIIVKENTEESQPVEKIITTEEFIKTKLDKLSDPDLVLKNKKAEKKNNRVSELPTYIESKHLYKFLLEYNQHPVLRYTCHEIDDEKIIIYINEMCGTKHYDIIKHQELIQKSFEHFEKGHYVHHRIKNLILVYLTGYSFSGKHNTWSTEKIKINWKSQELFHWGNTNSGIVPNPGENLINKIQNRGYKFKKTITSDLSGERITSFSGLVIHFKNLFHIKGDNPLKEIIKRINNKEQWDESIMFQLDHADFWTNLELFTDVDSLVQAYKALIRIILEAVKKYKIEKPIIKLIFKEEGSNIIFSIHHINSIYGKTINNTLERLGTSQTLLIKNQINGLCDLLLIADFDHNQFAEINLWDGNKRQSKKMENFQGVQYILKFKK